MKSSRIALFLFLPVIALGLAACGGPPNGDVALIKADVGPNLTIPQSQYDRFFNFFSSQAQQKPVAQMVPFVGPAYTACVNAAAKAQAPPKGSQRKAPSTTALKEKCKTQAATLRNQTMSQLINLNWIVAEARKRGITFRKAEVARELQSTIQTQFQGQAGYQNFLKSYGLNAADVNLNVLVQLAQTKIVSQLQSAVKAPTDADVKAYLAANAKQYATPETRDLRLIKTADEATAQKAYDALNAGGSWATLAKQYSTDAQTKDSGGVVSGATLTTQPPEFGNTVFNAKANTLLKPIKTSLGWYVVKVQKITPAAAPNLATLKPQIQQQLEQTNQNAAIDTFKKQFTAHWGARTSCKQGYDATVECGGFAGGATTPPNAPPEIVAKPGTNAANKAAAAAAAASAAAGGTGAASAATQTASQ